MRPMSMPTTTVGHLRISRLILATNENDILARFFNSGEYSLGPVTHTFAPSMDIQIASNFERYLYHKVDCDPQRLRQLMDGFARTGSLKIDAGGDGVDAAFAAGVGSSDDVLATSAK